MEKEEYRKMYEFENTYWWHIGRRAIIDTILRRFAAQNKYKMVVDMGCGTGVNFDFLKKYGQHIIGTDNSSLALSYAKKHGYDKLILTNDNSSSFGDNTVGIVVLFDVLEHLLDDSGTVKKINRILEDGGLLVIGVPPYQFLWSEHDVALHHYRRYTAKQLRTMLHANGFAVQKLSYCISFLFPIIVAYRMGRRLLKALFGVRSKLNTSYVAMPKPLNSFFVFLLYIESLLLSYVNFPVGTSIIAVAKKVKRNN